jgi:hypothetical protein
MADVTERKVAEEKLDVARRAIDARPSTEAVRASFG